VRSTIHTPTAGDASSLVRRVVDTFNTHPEICQTDQGTQFVSSDFTRTLAELSCRHVRSPVGASWTNGRVERFHRVINEKVRAFANDQLSSRQFHQIVFRATQLHNTSVSSVSNSAPHDMVFTYPSWIYSSLTAYRPKTILSAEANIEPEQQLLPSNSRPLPKIGETWLTRRAHSPKKFHKPYEQCVIVDRVSDLIYRVRFANSANNLVRVVHLRHLKSAVPASNTPSNVPGETED
jgi:transposase InsO family protein